MGDEDDWYRFRLLVEIDFYADLMENERERIILMCICSRDGAGRLTSPDSRYSVWFSNPDKPFFAVREWEGCESEEQLREFADKLKKDLTEICEVKHLSLFIDRWKPDPVFEEVCHRFYANLSTEAKTEAGSR
jgi:hypothetical protein